MSKEIFFAQIKRIFNPPKSYDTDILLETYAIIPEPDIKKQPLASGKWTKSEGFLLQKHSFVKKINIAKANKGINKILRDIQKRGFLKDCDEWQDYYELTHDIYLSSPSSASNLVHGCDTNGREMWMSDSGKSINELTNNT